MFPWRKSRGKPNNAAALFQIPGQETRAGKEWKQMQGGAVISCPWLHKGRLLLAWLRRVSFWQARWKHSALEPCLWGRKERDISARSFIPSVIVEVHTCAVCCAQWLSRVWFFSTTRVVALQAPLSMGILQARKLEWLPCPHPGDLPNPGIRLGSPAL